jgi:hypothetical protein
MLDFISKQQENIIKEDYKIKKILGCAGSRKTDTMIKCGIYEQQKNKEAFNIMFLTLVGSVSDEITQRIEKMININIYKYLNSNHYLGKNGIHHIEIANFDAFIHYQLQYLNVNLISIGQDYDKKTQLLYENIKNNKLNHFYLKNGEIASMILIDEFQDINHTKVNILIEFFKKNNETKLAVFGDMLQTIFPHAIDNSKHPLIIFNELNPKQYDLNICYRCPSSHIDVVNCIMKECQKYYHTLPIESMKHLKDNKPLFFCHETISTERGSYLTALLIYKMIHTLKNNDKKIEYADIAIIMKKNNNQNVFKYLHFLFKKNNLENFISYSKTKNIFNERMPIDWQYNENRVKMLSIHGDKGKGHPVVFLIGFSGNIIPEERHLHKMDEILSHSLLNVGLTRSTKYLFIGMTKLNPSYYFINKYNELLNKAYFSWNLNQIHHDILYKIANLNKDKPHLIHKDMRSIELLTPIKPFINIQLENNLFKYFNKPLFQKIKLGVNFNLNYNEDKLYILNIMIKLIFLKKCQSKNFESLFKYYLLYFKNNKYHYDNDLKISSIIKDFQLNILAIKNEKVWFEMIKNNNINLNEPKIILNTIFDEYFFNQMEYSILNENINYDYFWNLSIFYIEYLEKTFISNLFIYFNEKINQNYFIENNINRYINFLKNKENKLIFNPTIALVHKIEENTELKEMGFQENIDMDKNYFKDGYKYGITSNIDFIAKDNQILIDFRLSNELYSYNWIYQSLLHYYLSKNNKNGIYKTIHIYNLNKGLLLIINTSLKYDYKKIISQIMSTYQFNDLLINKLL